MKTLTLDEYADLPVAESSYLIDKFIPCPGRILLVGPPKKGKSFLALQIGLAIAKGESFMGRPSKASKVLYLQYDTPHSLWHERVIQLRKAGVKFDKNFIMIDPKEAKGSLDIIKNSQDVKYLQDIVSEIKPKLVIIDTLRKVFSGDENSSDVGATVFNTLNDVFKEQAVIYIHHTHKLSPPPGQKIQHKISPVDSVRGSSFFSGEVDAVYLLYGKYLSTDCRFDESTDYHIERDEITKLWTFPDTEKISKQEVKVRELWASKKWENWLVFRKHIMHTLVTIPDHLMSRLEEELNPSSVVSSLPLGESDLPES